jgi:hypothetical protein
MVVKPASVVIVTPISGLLFRSVTWPEIEKPVWFTLPMRGRKMGIRFPYCRLSPAKTGTMLIARSRIKINKIFR